MSKVQEMVVEWQYNDGILKKSFKANAVRRAVEMAVDNVSFILMDNGIAADAALKTAEEMEYCVHFEGKIHGPFVPAKKN